MSDRYVLARATTPVQAKINGTYFVYLEQERVEGVTSQFVANSAEIIEVSRDASALEWARLLDQRDALIAVQEIMDS